MNLNRAFPGHPEGSVTSQIAHYLTTVLFPLSDVVIDIHSGGRSMEFVPCSHMHLVPDKEQRKKMLAAMLAWNTDFSFLYADIAGSGLLPVEAENQGKIVVTTELGGGEGVSAQVHRICSIRTAQRARSFGASQRSRTNPPKSRQAPAILVQALNREDYLLAPESGIFEICIDLGQFGTRRRSRWCDPHLERTDRAPEPIIARSSGYLITARVPCLTQQGDCVAVSQGKSASTRF